MSKSDITVLHVDDDESFASLVADFINQTYDGIAIRTVHNGEEALARLEATDDIACIVSDYKMPGLNGLELLTAVRDRWPNLPFLLFTGEGTEDVAVQAINAGVTDYLQKKPVTSQYAVLVNRIQNMVAQHRAEIGLKQATQRTEAQFELLVDTVEDYAVFVLDEEGYVQTWNQGAENIKGYTSDEIIGEHFSTFYRDEEIEAGIPEQNLHEAATTGSTTDEGWRIRKDNPDSSWRPSSDSHVRPRRGCSHRRSRRSPEEHLRPPFPAIGMSTWRNRFRHANYIGIRLDEPGADSESAISASTTWAAENPSRRDCVEGPP